MNSLKFGGVSVTLIYFCQMLFSENPCRPLLNFEVHGYHSLYLAVIHEYQLINKFIVFYFLLVLEELLD